MRTLKETINQTAEQGEKIIAENPTLTSISFELTDFPVDEVKQQAKEWGSSDAEFAPHSSRVGFTLLTGSKVFIHVRSIVVKAKLVYEPETN